FEQLFVQLPGFVLQRLERLALIGEVGKAGHDAARGQLQRAKRGRIRAGREQRGDQRGATQLGRKELGKTRTLESPGRAFFLPDLRFRRKRQQQRDGNR